MRRIIHKIRLQPPEFRLMIAVIAAFIVTGVITFFWSSTLTHGIFQENTTDETLGPISALISNIKDIISTSKKSTTNSVTDSNTVQVIDMHDTTQTNESYPSSDTTSQP